MLAFTVLILAVTAGNIRSQVRKDKIYIDDGTGQFTILKSQPLGGTSQIINFPSIGGGTVILSNSPSGQTITGGLRINGGMTLGTMLAPQYGGTGLDASTAANGQLLIGNGSGFDLSELTGTDNQIIISAGAGTLTLTTPQDIGPSSSPTFAGETLGANSGAGPASGTTGSITLLDGTSSNGHSATVEVAPMASDRTITIPDPGANASMVTSEGTQTINGDKSLTGTTTLNLLTGSGTNRFAGTQELSAGQMRITILNTAITAASSIIATYEDLNDQEQVVPAIVAKVAGASFTVRLSGPVPVGADARVHFMIINP